MSAGAVKDQKSRQQNVIFSWSLFCQGLHLDWSFFVSFAAFSSSRLLCQEMLEEELHRRGRIRGEGLLAPGLKEKSALLAGYQAAYVVPGYQASGCHGQVQWPTTAQRTGRYSDVQGATGEDRPCECLVGAASVPRSRPAQPLSVPSPLAPVPSSRAADL